MQMYERLTKKDPAPDEAAIIVHLGPDSHARLEAFESRLKKSYELSRELRFPFGNSYGWGYKYSHKTSHLCYAFFEKNAFTITLQIGDKQVPSMTNALPSLSQKTNELWENRYPCGKEGGWIHYRVLTEEDLEDVTKLLFIRKKPGKKSEY